MGAVELLSMAASVSLLAGWRVYAAVFAAGLAMRFGLLPLPAHVASLDVLASPWVLGVAGAGMLAEFFADKIAWVDSLWDGIHTLVRPVGGAMLAVAMVDPADPAWQVATLLLGGGAAFASHTAKAGARAAINASPEPVSNLVMSSAEDVATTGALALAVTHPLWALGVVTLLIALAVAIMLAVRRAVADVRSLVARRPRR